MARTTRARPAEPTTISAPTIHGRLLSLDMLYLHPFNPRQEPPEAEIEALAQSIATLGLLQNLSGFADHQIRFRPGRDRENPTHIGIVAGGRRLRALHLLAARGEWTAMVPVSITDDPDTAKQWSGAENETQRGLPIADRIVAYRQMRDIGATLAGIASTFATPESDVRRLLALANLPPEAIEALRHGMISFEVAKALTTAATPEDLGAALRSAIAKDQPDWAIRKMLARDAISATSPEAIYLGIDAYHAAGGTSTPDLFAADTLLHDAALVKRLADEKALEETEARSAAGGWGWAEYKGDRDLWALRDQFDRTPGTLTTLPEADENRFNELTALDELTDEEDAELDELAARKQSHWPDADQLGILTYIARSGTLTEECGFRRRATPGSHTDSDDDSIETHKKAPEAAMPQNLRDDLRAIRLLALQAALAKDADLTTNLLAWQMSGRCSAWDGPFAFYGNGRTAVQLPGKIDGTTVPAFLKPQQTDADRDSTPADFLDMLHHDRHKALAHGLAREYCRPTGALADWIAARVKPDVRAIWAPTAAGFLGRVSGGYLDVLWCELVPDDGSAHAGFLTLSKKDKAKQLQQLFENMSLRETLGLSRDQNAAIDTWLPEDLRFAAPQEGGAE